MSSRSYKGAFVSTASFSKIPNIHAIKLAERTILNTVCFVRLQFEGKRPWKIELVLQRNNQILRGLARYTTVILLALLDEVVDISLYFKTLLRNHQPLYSPLFTNSSKLDLQNFKANFELLYKLKETEHAALRCSERIASLSWFYLEVWAAFFPASFPTHFGLFAFD